MGIVLAFDQTKRRIVKCDECRFKIDGIFPLCKESPLPSEKDDEGIRRPLRKLGNHKFFLLPGQMKHPYQYCSSVNPNGRCRKFIKKLHILT